MQECNRMNVLVFELKRSLLELVKGMDGQLNMTQAMEDLQTALTKNEVRKGLPPFARLLKFTRTCMYGVKR